MNIAVEIIDRCLEDRKNLLGMAMLRIESAEEAIHTVRGDIKDLEQEIEELEKARSILVPVKPA